MPTTTVFGWTTPADTDLVKDGASAIRTLASGIDTTVAVRQPTLIPVESTYYVSVGHTSQSTSVTQTKQQTYYLPIYLPSATFDRLSFRTNANHSGTIPTRLGIYANSTSNKPSTLILDAGTVSATATSTTYEITINQTLTNGWYWLAINGQSASGTMANNGWTNGLVTQSSFLASTATTANSSSFYTQTGVTGAFANAGTLVSVGSAPDIRIRIA